MFLIILILFLSSTIEAQQISPQFSIEKVPNWVNVRKSEEIQISDKIDPNLSVRYMLVDYQVNLNFDISYNHYIRKVLNEEGIQNEVELSFLFDPEYQKLIFHSIIIKRGEKRINKLIPEDIKIIQRESNLERKIYDGSLTAILLLEDIRIGDIIDYQYSIDGENPAFEGKYSEFFRFSWASPVDLIHYSIVIPEKRSVNYLNHNFTKKPLITKKGTDKIYEWQVEDTKEFVYDDNLPNWCDPNKYVQISEYKSWNEVAKSISNLYEIDCSLSKELKLKIDDIKKSNSTKDDQIIAALRYVQDDIKYLGLEFGINGYKPHNPNDVNRRRFGDCKDKTNLLCTILNELGVKANPFLVNTSFRDSIKNWLPSFTAFDHVITKLNLNGKSYWVDPTASLQGGEFNSIVPPNYKLGLTISQDPESLEPIESYENTQSKIVVLEEYISDGYENPVKLKIISDYFGNDANSMRAYLQGNSHKSISKNYLDYLSRYFKDVKIKDSIKFVDDRSMNLLTITENYVITNFWELSEDSLQYEQSLYPTVLSYLIPSVESSTRLLPFALSYPNNVENIVRINLHDNWRIPSSEKIIENDYLLYKSNRNYNGSEVAYRYSFKTKMDHVPPNEYSKFYDDVKSIGKLTGEKLFKNIESNTNFSLNSTLLILTLFISFSIIYFCRKVYKNHFFIKINRAEFEIDPKYEGIKGWIIFWLSTSFLGIIINLFTFYNSLYLFNQNTWLKFTSTSSDFFVEFWALAVIFQLFSIIFTILINAFAIFSIFMKKIFVPRLVIFMIVINIVVMFVNSIYFDAIILGQAQPIIKVVGQIVGAVLSGAIWISYFYLSKRVKNTFVKY